MAAVDNRRAAQGSPAASIWGGLLFDLRGYCPDFPPGQPWVSIDYLDDARHRVVVELLNNAQAPVYPVGSRLAGVEVRTADSLAPGYYLVCDRRFAGIDYVGHLLAEDITTDGLGFSFDGLLPEPVVCGVRRGPTHKVRLYRLANPVGQPNDP